MNTRTKTSIHIWVPSLFMLATLLYCPIASASSLRLDSKGSLLEIQADQISLGEILGAISLKIGLTIRVSGDLNELVSMNHSLAPPEKIIRRLLGKKNYVLQYKEKKNGTLFPMSLYIFGNGPTSIVHEEQTSGPPDDHMKAVDSGWFEKTFEDTERHLEEISATADSDGPHGQGIRITEIAKDSPLDQLGIERNDILHNVNGKPVETVEGLIETLRDASGPQTIIRIERSNTDHQTDPLYIEFH